MRKLMAVMGVGAVLALTASPAHAMSAAVDPSGIYGPQPCYTSVEYFKVTASVESTSPYVNVDTEGNVGAHVVCPLAEDPVDELRTLEINADLVPTIDDMIITH